MAGVGDRSFETKNTVLINVTRTCTMVVRFAIESRAWSRKKKVRACVPTSGAK